ncbi:hypothetical protein D0C36_16965 [Mucilaginibacter conchicola]|uniref:Uncharacterized protein n=1 Tax=Mucilaginibacter conchicola TaxID=2303333 RepID=A0A372NNZ9_9SPHI|nr:hypothetical protein [Mucilaginibacter conchicola]RFZ90654.1 hypothetical protein D0C36_16965 [Mucilaginibacter conchicola]
MALATPLLVLSPTSRYAFALKKVVGDNTNNGRNNGLSLPLASANGLQMAVQMALAQTILERDLTLMSR